MQKKLGFIGCGNMAQAIIKGIVKSQIVKPDMIIASNPTNSKLELIEKETGINITNDNIEVGKKADILFICVKPYKYSEVIKEIKDYVKYETVIVTIAAGITMKMVENDFGKKVKVIRTMPNTPALVQEGMTSICQNEYVTTSEINYVINILKSFGRVEIVEEKLMNTVCALTGSSPAFVYMFIEALSDGAVLKGLPRDKAYTMAAQAVLGSAKMVLQTKQHPGKLKDDVCSPSGTTIESVYSLEKSGFRGAVIEAVEKCVNKADNIIK